MINSQLYVSGGWNGPLPTTTLFMYDPPSNTWTPLAGMSHLSACGATGVINSKLYVTTACNGYSGYSNYLDVYDPVANAWTSLPGSAGAHGSPAFGVINDLLYVAGGTNAGGGVSNVLEVYNPATNAWKTLAPMPAAVQFSTSVVLNGQLYVFGGNNGTDYVATVQAYDPYKNKWRTLPSLPSPLGFPAVQLPMASYSWRAAMQAVAASPRINMPSLVRRFPDAVQPPSRIGREADPLAHQSRFPRL